MCGFEISPSFSPCTVSHPYKAHASTKPGWAIYISLPSPTHPTLHGWDPGPTLLSQQHSPSHGNSHLTQLRAATRAPWRADEPQGSLSRGQRGEHTLTPLRQSCSSQQQHCTSPELPELSPHKPQNKGPAHFRNSILPVRAECCRVCPAVTKSASGICRNKFNCQKQFGGKCQAYINCHVLLSSSHKVWFQSSSCLHRTSII